MTLIRKLSYLLNRQQKINLILLSVLLFLGTILEMFSLGILIPLLGIMTSNNLLIKYPFLKPYLSWLGNPSQQELVVLTMLFIIILYLFKGIFLIFLNWKQSNFSAKLSADLSTKLFVGYLSQPYNFHLQKNSALLNFNISEASSLSGFSNTIMMALLECTVILGIALMLFFVEPLGAIIVSIFLLISGMAFHRFTKKKVLVWGQKRQFHLGQSNKHLMQGLGGVKDIKLNGRERFFLESFSNHIQENAKIGTKATTLNLVPRIYLEILAVFAMAGLVIVFIIQNKPLDSLITILGIFIVAAFRMIPSANRIMMSIQNIRAAYPTVDLVYNEFCNINQEAKKNNIDEQKLNFSNQIVIKNLDFSYTNKLPYTIENISLVINKGESIGLIGPSGSGKSTLVDLVLGLLKPNHGEINIDGVNIENILRSWQKQIGYVSQSIYLTDDTLRNNIAFGINESQIDDFSINRAIKAAQLEEFINTLPDGINTNVGERGVRLSGGQRQRIGIARALYPDPSVLVLDEATSALDTNTEKEVMNAVNGLHGEKTLIIIAHRLTTVENCDKIYKISNGKLVYSGSPQKIL